MGSYFELTIGKCEIYSSKSHVEPELMSLFSMRDRHYEWKKYKDIYPEDELEVSEFDNDYAVCKYLCKLPIVKKRLDILGFDLPTTISDFENQRQTEIQKYEDWSKDGKENTWSETIEILKTSGFQTYLDTYKEIFKNHIYAFDYQKQNLGYKGLIKYILDADYGDPHMGFPCSDIRFFFRAFLEVVPYESLVVLDISELVNNGYYEFDEEITSIAYHQLTSDYPINAKIIVLCEGTSDKAILERSIHLWYPDFSDHYSFMDFSVSRAQGGAAALVSTLKAFMAAGIENRIIALFDNDTAARSARKPLSNIKFPDNIKIISYPEFEFLKSYPTIGPSGIQKLDVNGLAGSIELYLGKDCIESENKLSPVQWKGYLQELDAYHGEVLNKAQIQQNFYKKLEDCESSRENIANYDWEGIKIIINSIFNCFGCVTPNKTINTDKNKVTA